MQDQMETLNRKRREEAREDQLMAERYLKEQDRKEREREAAVQARKDHLDMISKRMGTGLLLEKKEKNSQLISEMKVVLAKQIEEKQRRFEVIRQEEQQQGEIFARQAAHASVEDKELVQRRREQRRILDTYLAKQIEENRS